MQPNIQYKKFLAPQTPERTLSIDGRSKNVRLAKISPTAEYLACKQFSGTLPEGTADKTLERLAYANKIADYVRKTLRRDHKIGPTNIKTDTENPIERKAMVDRFKFTQSTIYDFFDSDEEIKKDETLTTAMAAAWPSRWGMGNCDQNAYATLIEACKTFPEDCKVQITQENNIHLICQVLFPDGMKITIDPWLEDPIVLDDDRQICEQQKQFEQLEKKEDKDDLLKAHGFVETKIDEEFDKYQREAIEFYQAKKADQDVDTTIEGMFEKTTSTDFEELDIALCDAEKKSREKLLKAFKTDQRLAKEDPSTQEDPTLSTTLKDIDNNRDREAKKASHKRPRRAKSPKKNKAPSKKEMRNLEKAKEKEEKKKEKEKQQLMHEIRSHYIQMRMDHITESAERSGAYIPKEYPHNQFTLPDDFIPNTKTADPA